MTNEHPITPPPELVAKLWREASAGRDDAPIGEIFNHGVYLAYRAGADQELEAMLAELKALHLPDGYAARLRAARRPKPPSLKEQALAELVDAYDEDKIDDTAFATIRRALEALDDLPIPRR